jgi:hypothetical protein
MSTEVAGTRVSERAPLAQVEASIRGIFDLPECVLLTEFLGDCVRLF